ncbi:MAG: hypothetical protein HYR58_03995 [Acidobacteria bacterium]|nr:hypothetical protein [Acidobacteriota bacterium]MBI3483572.1 hypothetical protein [Acidobacteriota bacterium]
MKSHGVGCAYNVSRAGVTVQNPIDIRIHLDFAPNTTRYVQAAMEPPGAAGIVRASMLFDLVREMILASLPKDLSPDELRRRLYERIYGEPLPADFKMPDDDSK